jgi:RNA polymerase sigma-70 factor (ECF subfamily)
MDDAHRVVEMVAREAYGRLVSYLSARARDVASAEDALADAFLAALRTWPCTGVPAKPEAWLLATARHRLLDRTRHERMRVEAIKTLRRAVEEAEAMSAASIFPDERLKLLFVCAHPAIDASVHTPLMLQVVLGLDAATIAPAFLVSPATLGQRLVRAKAKIRDAGIAFEVPRGSELPQRLGTVLEAIYAAYGSGWDDVAGADTRRRGLTDEAIWLAGVLLALLPEEPEARGLLALMLYCEARRQARRAHDGAYVPLSEQDTRLWSMPLIAQAERLLASAARQQRAGRFQLEAAIQSAHVERARCDRIDWHAIALLYEGLVRMAPTLGALVGRAAALAEARGPDAGVALLDDMRPESVQTYQPYWAVRAHLLQQLGRRTEALEAFDRAIALTEDDAIRQFLLRRRGQEVTIITAPHLPSCWPTTP